MVESPAPLMSHSLAGLPGLQFSATISLTGEMQGPVCGSVTNGIGPAVLIAEDGLAVSSRAEPAFISAVVPVNTTGIAATKTISAARQARLHRGLISSLVGLRSKTE